jgi:hypothetical protein
MPHSSHSPGMSGNIFKLLTTKVTSVPVTSALLGPNIFLTCTASNILYRFNIFGTLLHLLK